MHEYRCKIRRVVDGDTVDVDIDLGFGVWLQNERVRLYGIDAPESRTRDRIEKLYGLYAKEFLKDALGKECVLRTMKDDKGKFGRILGTFVVDGVNINEQMIEEKIAVAYSGQSKEEIKEEHLTNRDALGLHINC